MSEVAERRTPKRIKLTAVSGVGAAVYGAVSWSHTIPALSASIWIALCLLPAVIGLIAVVKFAPHMGAITDEDQDYVAAYICVTRAMPPQHASAQLGSKNSERMTFATESNKNQIQQLTQRLHEIDCARCADKQIHRQLTERCKLLELHCALQHPQTGWLLQRVHRQENDMHCLTQRLQALEAENNVAISEIREGETDYQ